MQHDRMTHAKRMYSAACEAYLRGDADAVEQCRKALAELEAARKAAEAERRPPLRRIQGGRK